MINLGPDMWSECETILLVTLYVTCNDIYEYIHSEAILKKKKKKTQRHKK